MRILHTYKIFSPDVEGGIPTAIGVLVEKTDKDIKNSILVGRYFGAPKSYLLGEVPVVAVASLGTVFSTPLAPTFPYQFFKLSRQADIVVHHAPFPITDLAVLLGLPRTTGLVVHWHADMIGRPILRWLISPLIRRTLRRADRIVISHPLMIETSAFLKQQRHKCVVIPYGIDVEYWGGLSDKETSEVAALRQECPDLILAIGRLVSYKGFDVLFRAIALTKATVAIIGIGPLKSDLEDLTTQLGIRDRVRFLGDLERNEIRKFLHAARALAFPSITEAEGFGIVQLEAMAAGTPVINTSLATTVPLVARHEREGLTVPPRDEKALAAAIERLTQNPDLADTFGKAGRIRAIAEFTDAKFRGSYKQLYVGIMSTKTPQRTQS